MTHRFKFLLSWTLAIALLALPSGLAQSRGQEPGATPRSAQAWTLEEALTALALQPRDAYLQYVVLQLARRAGRFGEVAPRVQGLIPNDADVRAERREGVDLFSLFSGALAVQESLQLDTMRAVTPPAAGGSNRPAAPALRNEPPPTPPARRTQTKPPSRTQTARRGARRGGAATQTTTPLPIAAAVDPTLTRGQANTQPQYRPGESVAVSSLAGPSVKSHPWERMLAGRRPDISPLARDVPDDFYFVEFRTLTRLLDAFDAGDLWGTHLFNQAYREADTVGVGERLKRQLAIESDPRLRPFYDLVVEEVAVAGSDPFVREGSDVTLLFRVKQPEIFHARMDAFLSDAERAHADARRTTGQYLGVAYVQIENPERDVSVVAADPEPGLHLRSNSLAAFRRVVAAIKGKTEDGTVVRRLGDTAEFAYARTLMPRGDEREDGFIYLSDPFIRRLVGPELKLTERRRLVCYNHLRMIGHASLLFRTEHGRWPDSLEELARAGDAPGLFGEGALSCPDGGHYTLSADKTTGVCSRHGHALHLTPNVETPAAQVTGAEANEYRAFVEDYNRYWRFYFDPVAIRLKVSPEQYRVETIILPLIDNSVYTSLASALGGKPEALDSLPVPRRDIFSASFRLNKEKYLDDLGLVEKGAKPGEPAYVFGHPTDAAMNAKAADFVSRGLGNQVGFHLYDAHPTFDLNTASLLGWLFGSGVGHGARSLGGEEFYIALALTSLNSPVYLSFPVRDAKVVDDYLTQLDTVLSVAARNERRGRWLDFEYDFYKYQLPTGETARAFGLRLDPARLRFFWARVGSGLYVASKPFILEDLAGAAQGQPAGASQTQAANVDADATGHALVRVRAQNWNDVLPDYRLAWAENEREACLNNLAALSDAARALSARAAGQTGGQALSGEAFDRAVVELADRLHGTHHFCPEGGTYHVSPDGRTVSCSVHGTADAPRQPVAPSEHSPAGRTMRELSDLTATLTFMEDGLHAVLVVNRK